MADFGWEDQYKNALASLNSWQRAIVDDLYEGARRGEQRPLRVIASAGSGKTRSTVVTVAHIVNNEALRPEDVVVTTFTRKAGNELTEKLREVVNPKLYSRLSVSERPTFHALAISHMRERVSADTSLRRLFPHGFNMAVNVEKGDRVPFAHKGVWYGILQEPKTKKGIPGWKAKNMPPSRAYDEIPGLEGTDFYGLSVLSRWGDTPSLTAATPRDYKQAIDIIRAQGLSRSEELAQKQIAQFEEGSHEDSGERLPMLNEAWRWFDEFKARNGYWDFADSLEAMWKYGTTAAKLVLIDEAQDNNLVQLNIGLDMARRGGGRLALIGDIRQAIYSWRGAEPRFMQNADQEPINATTLEIPTNYRSGRQIVTLGNDIALGEPWSVGTPAVPARLDTHGGVPCWLKSPDKRLYPECFLPEGEVVVQGFDTPTGEAEGVATDIKDHLDKGGSPRDCAILLRTNKAGEFFEMALLMQRVPVLRLGESVPFFDRVVVADAQAYAILSETDHLESLERVANKSRLTKRYIGKETLAKIMEGVHAGLREGRGILEALQVDVIGKRLIPRDDGVKDLLKVLAKLREAGWKGVPQVVQPLLVDERDIEDDEKAQREDADGALFNKWAIIAGQFDSAAQFEQFARRMRRPKKKVTGRGKSEEERNAEVLTYSEFELDNMTPEQRAEFEAELKRRVTISTVHRAKGLQWRRIFVSAPRMQFPHIRSQSEKRLAEEQRLFYVACTRAENRLMISYPEVQDEDPTKLIGPSKFIEAFATPMLQRERLLDEALTAALAAPWPLQGDPQIAVDRMDFAWRNPTSPDWHVKVTPAPEADRSKRIGPDAWKAWTRIGLDGEWTAIHGAIDEESSETTETWEAPVGAVRAASRYMEAQQGGVTRPEITTDPIDAVVADFAAYVARLEGYAAPGLTYQEFAARLTDPAYRSTVAAQVRKFVVATPVVPSIPIEPEPGPVEETEAETEGSQQSAYLVLPVPMPIADVAGVPAAPRPLVWVQLPPTPPDVENSPTSMLFTSLPLLPDLAEPREVPIPRPSDSKDKRAFLARLGAFVATLERSRDHKETTLSVYRIDPGSKPAELPSLTLVGTHRWTSATAGPQWMNPFLRGLRKIMRARWRADELDRLLAKQGITNPELLLIAREVFEGGGDITYESELGRVCAEGAETGREGNKQDRCFPLRITASQIRALVEAGIMEETSDLSGWHFSVGTL